jgi:hypothetical protein
MAQDEWTPEAVARTLMNPRYCLSDSPVVTDEIWIEANARLIDVMGPHTFPATLLSVLREPQPYKGNVY